MEFTAQFISSIIEGTVEGNPDATASKPAKIEEADENSICFISNPKYESYAYATKAAILLVSDDFNPTQPVSPTLIRVRDVRLAVSKLLAAFSQISQTKTAYEVHELAYVDKTATIGKEVSIAAFSYIAASAQLGDKVRIYEQVYIGENVKIGNNTILYPGVKILNDCVVGDNCILHPNVVIGSDGFGFAPQEDGSYEKIPHVGNVVIGNKVEIGTNTVIDRAVMGSTVIYDGVKLDNLIQIAHNVEVGEHTAIASQAGIAGSTKVGKRCLIGGQAGLVGHITIADGTKIQAQSGIAKSLKKENGAWYGSPAFEYSAFLKSQVYFQKLPQLEKRIRELEKQLKDK